ncbi:hypothetical protein [Thermodesulforhabdus norvegica]|uniref:Uncharacterized protein n=1 Tax=Thermodesulforhabdus norvegica TaxID=39841 RepID=A0A1I4QKR7_9BACT|nr:hypothetical protein [Thermodesulforhabdus norvegica]SFM40692.1 hypothetical protein SAMN05660836_00092 [Thermodesulforhabdus norvegica]
MDISSKAECRECEFAVYCFTEPSQWVFRTKKDVEEIKRALETCPIRPLVGMGYREEGRAFLGNEKS